MTTLTLTENELRLLWLASETLRDANPGDAEVESLDAKIAGALHAATRPSSRASSSRSAIAP